MKIGYRDLVLNSGERYETEIHQIIERIVSETRQQLLRRQLHVLLHAYTCLKSFLNNTYSAKARPTDVTTSSLVLKL